MLRPGSSDRKPEEPSLGGSRAFVVLVHADRHGLHYDLMIDLGERLASWKCLLPPEQSGAAGQACERLADHRRVYLDYEGPISGGRGHVRRHDAGACTVLEQLEDRWLVVFAGQRLTGRYELVRQPAAPQSWQLRSLHE